MSYDIINKNLEKLNNAIEQFPEIFKEYRKLGDKAKKATEFEERTRISSMQSRIEATAGNLGLGEYITLMKWVDSASEPIIQPTMTWNQLKVLLLENCFDNKVKVFLEKKTKRGFLSFVDSELFQAYKGAKPTGRRGSRKYYSNNFGHTTLAIANFLIQNDIKLLENEFFFNYYYNEIKNFECNASIELSITKDILKGLSRRINSLKYDFKRMNISMLEREISSLLRTKVMTIEKGEKIKCIEAQNGLTLTKVYDVLNYDISLSTGSLIVFIIDDNGRNSSYNYRLFENVTKFRDDRINEMLSFLDEE